MPRDDAPAFDPLTLAIGVLGRPHGVRGEMALRPYNPTCASLEGIDTVLLEKAGRREERAIRNLRPVADGYLVAFEGITTREEASALTLAVVRVGRDRLPPLEPGEYYVEDVVGCVVTNDDGTVLGTVTGTFWNGAHDVMEVAGAQEHLIPLVPDFVVEVDAPARKVRVSWQEV